MANNRELSQFANVVGYNGGSIGIGTDKPLDPTHTSNTKVLSVGIVTANYLYGDGSNLTNVSGGGSSGINTDAQNNHYGIDQNGRSFSGTDATNNTLFGHQAGYNITTADKNVVIGSLAGDALTTGIENVSVGYNAGSGETTQNGDVAVGAYTLFENDGQYNVAIGYRAGTSTGSSSDRGVFLGYWAGAYVGGDDNISIGNFSMGGRTTTGGYNVAIGRNAGYDLGASERNVFVGDFAGYSVIGGDYNTFIGERSGYHFDNDASSNIAIGRRAAYNVDGNNNTIIGSMEYTGITTMNGQVAIGAGTTELVRINDNGLGIGLTNPDWHLDIKSTSVNAVVRLKSTGSTNGGQLQVNSDDLILRNRDAGNLQLWTNDAERLRITSDGKVGIGSEIPTDILDIRTGSGDEVTEFKVKTAGQLELTRSHASAPYIKTQMNSGNPNIILGDSGGDKVFINGDGDSYFNGGDVGINVTSPSERFHMSGAIRQDGASVNVQYTQMCFTLPAGTTSTMFTLTGAGTDATAMAVLEYVALYAYAGSNHCAGIEYASTRRSSNNTAWTDTDNQSVAVSGNDTSIAPNIFWDNGVLKITTGSSVQITGTLRLTTRRFTVTRNFSAG